MADELTLSVNGSIFGGWQSVSVRRSLRTISGSFDLSVIDKWAQDQTAWKIVPGDSCTLTLAGEVLVTGFIDKVSPSVTKDGRSISVSGRDLTGDLVDCSVNLKQYGFQKISLVQLVKLLAAPFKIKVEDTAQANKPFNGWTIHPGESAFEVIERAAKLKGVLVITDGQGTIEITGPGTSRASSNLEYGVNILEASSDYDFRERFSKYIVNGMNGLYAQGTPGLDLAPSAAAYDSVIKRARTKILIAEGNADPAICQKRAKWEAAVRVAKSTRVKVSVQGWTQADGTPWTINELVHINCPPIGIDLDMLISETVFQKSSSGTTTQLLLEPSYAYIPDPTAIDKKDAFEQLVLAQGARR